MADFKPSSYQEQAITARTNAVVAAGAGAGKTFVLVEHYYHTLVEQYPEWPIESVVTVTFTRKAAAEMRKRLRTKLDRALADATLDAKTRDRVRALREQLTLAPIGTIHAFCGYVLRTYCFEAGCDPEFAVLDDTANDRVLDECVAATIEKWSQGTDEQLQKLLRLLMVLGAHRKSYRRNSGLHSLVKGMLSARGDYEPVARRYVSTSEEELTRDLAQYLADYALARSDVIGTDAAEAWDPDAAFLKEAQATVAVVRPAAELFLDALEEYHLRCSAAKNAQRTDLLDFVALELRVRDLLRDRPEVRDRLRSDVRHLIVDEFQDTSLLQWEIFRYLVCDDHGQMLPGRFFAVGDIKQSIYSFRQANTQVFVDACAQVERGKRGGVFVPLNQCYRMARAPLALVNRFFEELWREVELTGNPGHLSRHFFEPLELVRTEQTGSAWWLRAVVNKRDSTERLALEAEIIATMIGELLKLPGKDEEKITPGDIAILMRKRKYFLQVEAALRRRNIPFVTIAGGGLFGKPEVIDLLSALEAALDPHDNFTMLRYLRSSIVNCSDELLLKITICGEQLSRSGLWKRCWRALKTDGAEHEFALTAMERGRLEFAISLIEDVRARIGLVNVADLLRLVIERTGALDIWRRVEHGEQAAANIERVLNLAQSKDTCDIVGFLEDAQRQQDDLKGESEQVLESAARGAVKIMTIHAAKGLEFPVVFAAGLAETFEGMRSSILCNGEWFGFNKTADFQELEKETTNQEDASGMTLFRLLREQADERTQDEEKRVLYVAMTRCRDHLFLCTTEQDAGKSERKTGRSYETARRRYSAWLEQCLAKESVTRECTLATLGEDAKELFRSKSSKLRILRIRDVAPARDVGDEPSGNREAAGGKQVRGTEEFERGVAALEEQLLREIGVTRCQIEPVAYGKTALIAKPRDEGVRLPLVGAPELRFDFPPFALPIVGKPAVREMPVTAFLDFWDCPQLFFRQRVLGTQKTFAKRVDGGGASPASLDPATRGSLLHMVFEHILRGDASTKLDELEDVVAHSILLVQPVTLETARELANKLVVQALETKEKGLFAMIQAASGCSFEKRYDFRVGRFLFTAVLDCEFLSPEGTVEVADFKTDLKTVDERTRTRYERQMMFYLLAVAQAYPEQARYRAHLLYTDMGKHQTLEMDGTMLRAFEAELSEMLQEYEAFAAKFCRDELVLGPAVEIALGRWCAARPNPCPTHASLVGKD